MKNVFVLPDQAVVGVVMVAMEVHCLREEG